MYNKNIFIAYWKCIAYLLNSKWFKVIICIECSALFIFALHFILNKIFYFPNITALSIFTEDIILFKVNLCDIIYVYIENILLYISVSIFIIFSFGYIIAFKYNNKTIKDCIIDYDVYEFSKLLSCKDCYNNKDLTPLKMLYKKTALFMIILFSIIIVISSSLYIKNLVYNKFLKFSDFNVERNIIFINSNEIEMIELIFSYFELQNKSLLYSYKENNVMRFFDYLNKKYEYKKENALEQIHKKSKQTY